MEERSAARPITGAPPSALPRQPSLPHRPFPPSLEPRSADRGAWRAFPPQPTWRAVPLSSGTAHGPPGQAAIACARPVFRSCWRRLVHLGHRGGLIPRVRRGHDARRRGAGSGHAEPLHRGGSPGAERRGRAVSARSVEPSGQSADLSVQVTLRCRPARSTCGSGAAPS